MDQRTLSSIFPLSKGPGLGTLREGQKLTYELQAGQNGKSSAENLSVAD